MTLAAIAAAFRVGGDVPERVRIQLNVNLTVAGDLHGATEHTGRVHLTLSTGVIEPTNCEEAEFDELSLILPGDTETDDIS